MNFKTYLIIFIIVIVVVLLYIVGAFIDEKRDYKKNDILARLMNKENGQQYIAITAFIWQLNKIRTVKKLYMQNTIHTFNNFDYIITSCLKDSISNFLYHDFEYGVTPYSSTEHQNITNIIYVTDSNNITINLTNSINYEEAYREVNKANIDKADKEMMLEYLNDLNINAPFEKSRVNSFLNLLKKYESVFTFAANIITILSSILSI